PFARLPHSGPVQWRSEASFPTSGGTSTGKIDFDTFRAWAAAENLDTYGEKLNEPYLEADTDGKEKAFGETGDWFWEVIYFPSKRHFTLHVNQTKGTFRIFSNSPR